LGQALSKYEKGILRETYYLPKSSIKNVREESKIPKSGKVLRGIISVIGNWRCSFAKNLKLQRHLQKKGAQERKLYSNIVFHIEQF
jgi:hypothetical protein